MPWPPKHKPKRHHCLSLSAYPHPCPVSQFQGGLSTLLCWALEAAPSSPILTSDALCHSSWTLLPLLKSGSGWEARKFLRSLHLDVTNTSAASNPHSTPKMTCCTKRQDVHEWPHFFRNLKDILKLLLKLQGRQLKGGEGRRNFASVCWHTCYTKGN